MNSYVPTRIFSKGHLLLFFVLTLLSGRSMANIFSSKSERIKFIKENNLTSKTTKKPQQRVVLKQQKPEVRLINYHGFNRRMPYFNSTQHRRFGGFQQRRGFFPKRRMNFSRGGMWGNRNFNSFRRRRRRGHHHQRHRNLRQLRVSGTNLCIDFPKRRSRGDTIHLWKCDRRNKNQHFSFEKGMIRHVRGECIDAWARGPNIHKFKCDPRNSNQRFRWNPATKQIHSANGRCIEVIGRARQRAWLRAGLCHPFNRNQKFDMIRLRHHGNTRRRHERKSVVAYKHCGFRGPRMTVRPPSSKLSTRPLEISSFKIPRGYSVTVYSQPFFRGRRQTFHRTIRCLRRDWNDKVASFKVFAKRRSRRGRGRGRGRRQRFGRGRRGQMFARRGRRRSNRRRFGRRGFSRRHHEKIR